MGDTAIIRASEQLIGSQEHSDSGARGQNYAEALCNLGRAFEQLQDYRQAMTNYNRSQDIAVKTALESDPLLIRIALVRARCLSKMGQHADAEAVLKKVESDATKTSAMDTQQRSLVFAQLGAIAERAGHNDQALAYYERAIQVQSKVTTLYPQFVDMLARYGALPHKLHYDAEAASISKQVEAENLAMHRTTDPQSL